MHLCISWYFVSFGGDNIMCIVDGLMRLVTAERSEIHATEEFDCCIWFNSSRWKLLASYLKWCD